MNGGLTGLDRHEGKVINDRIFIFGWTIPLIVTLADLFVQNRDFSILKQNFTLQ